ncbi:hypothetical protein [Cupriavidus sp. IDO]|uniref:hypothetical protein n=1 Tax=Cupriavidus sp. IDO TaxID=1539142 RepID=UPI0005798520|nr:hypothetical protein [Cupriavidus sp. IDO]KWR87622.1 hypothetical protein RM96_24030 [Cupriavidus sp. IDO]
MKTLAQRRNLAVSVLCAIGLSLTAASVAHASEAVSDLSRLDGSIGKVDPYLDGAKVGKFDPYTDGAKLGKVDPFTDGANLGKRDPFTDGANIQDARDAFTQGA